MTCPPLHLSMDSFDVIRVVGEGSYGVVLKCRCRLTGSIVAIKRFKDFGNDEYAQRIMLRELRVLKLLKGELNVVQLKGAFRDGGRLCLVMEYVSGTLLDVLRERPNGVPLSRLKALLYTLLVGLRSCHRNGIIHRDVKPENTLVRHGNISLLCDFGTSRTINPPASSTTTSGGLLQAPKCHLPRLTDYVATRWYRSPEMLLGIPNYGFASDMWAVGAFMAELALGEPLLPGKSEMDQLALIRQRIGEFPASLTENISSISTRKVVLRPLDINKNRKTDKAEHFLSHRYRRVLGDSGCNLLRSLLSIDPNKRCTVEEALAHPFFDGLLLNGICTQSIHTVEDEVGGIGSKGRHGGFSDFSNSHDNNNGTNDITSRSLLPDKWFGLGEGKPVNLRELETFYSADAVEPSTPETLLLEAALCAGEPKKVSSRSEFNLKEKGGVDAVSPPSSCVQLPSISVRSTHGINVSIPPQSLIAPSSRNKGDLGLPSLKGLIQLPEKRSPSLNGLSCPSPVYRNVGVIPFSLIASSILRKNGGDFGENDASLCVNKRPSFMLNPLPRPSLKKRGRLVFITRHHTESL